MRRDGGREREGSEEGMKRERRETGRGIAAGSLELQGIKHKLLE